LCEGTREAKKHSPNSSKNAVLEKPCVLQLQRNAETSSTTSQRHENFAPNSDFVPKKRRSTSKKYYPLPEKETCVVGQKKTFSCSYPQQSVQKTSFSEHQGWSDFMEIRKWKWLKRKRNAEGTPQASPLPPLPGAHMTVPLLPEKYRFIFPKNIVLFRKKLRGVPPYPPFFRFQKPESRFLFL
jgi:hypothetical protein